MTLVDYKITCLTNKIKHNPLATSRDRTALAHWEALQAYWRNRAKAEGPGTEQEQNNVN